MKKFVILICLPLLVFASGCKKDSDGSKNIAIVSTALNDGFVVNSTTRVLYSSHTGSQGEEIRIGWDAQGKAMRGFLSFSLAGILPADDQLLKVDKAILKVYESNTNLHPFDGEGARTVQVELVDFGTLDVADYTAPSIENCGTIADWGYSVLHEHSLDVTSEAAGFLISNLDAEVFQFMLHFTNDNNITPATSTLESNMWNIFAGEETDLTEYRPVLELKYHYEKK